jgi:carbonic anhydrase
MKPLQKLGPGAALEMLKDGNRRFRSGRATHPHIDRERLKLAGAEDQSIHAYATILACSDSRVPVEIIFDAGIMDLFVIRVAGNICRADEIGTIEYGLAHVKTPLVVILGHTKCGALTAATQAFQGRCPDLECNIQPTVEGIEPVCRLAADEHPEASDDEVIPYAIEENVWQGIRDLFLESPTARDYVRQGIAKVVGAVYDLGTGEVRWLPEERVTAILGEVEEASDKRV